MCLAIGAPQIAVLGVLGEDDAGDLRVVARREEHEPAVVAHVHLAAPAALAPVSEMTCAVPVLPETSRPSISRAAAGAGAVDDQPQPVVHRARRSTASSSTVDCGGGGGTGFQPVPSSTALSTCGVYRVPPLATRHHHDGQRQRRHATCPWPIATEIVSPGYHFSLRIAPLPLGGRHEPCTSFGRSMPVLSPRPSAVAHLWIRSTPSMLPSV